MHSSLDNVWDYPKFQGFSVKDCDFKAPGFVLQFQSFLAFLFVPCIETEFQHFLSLSVFVDAIT